MGIRCQTAGLQNRLATGVGPSSNCACCTYYAVSGERVRAEDAAERRRLGNTGHERQRRDYAIHYCENGEKLARVGYQRITSYR